MHRRHFVVGGVLTLAACSSPRRDLLEGRDIDDIELRVNDPEGDILRELDNEASQTTPPSAEPDLATVAEAIVDEVDAFGAPGGDPIQSFVNPIPSGGPLVFLVDETIPGWHKVLLPIRPNGATGWVRSDDVTLTSHHFRILVELSQFRLRVFDRGEQFFERTIGIARDNTPTPQGRYYTTELLQPPNPNTVYGRFAYGLSGYSEVLTEFEGGPGQLGIHGTNEPQTIGERVSAGCIRLRDEDIELLVPILPLGVPVEVMA